MPRGVPAKPQGVAWETVIRWAWDGNLMIELRAMSATEVEVKATTANALGSMTATKVVTFEDARKALDALEASARETERL